MGGDGGPAPTGSRIYRIAWALYLVLAVAGAVWMGIDRGGLALGQLITPERWWRDLLWGLGGGAVLLALWEAGRRVLPLARELERAIAEVLAGIEPSEALALALLSGFAEELFFRGAVQGEWGLWIATALFALLHTGPGRPFRLWTAFAAVAGLVFGLLALHTGSLLAPISAHVAVNAINLRRLAREGAGGGPER